MNTDKIYPWIKRVEGTIPNDGHLTLLANDGSTTEAVLPWHRWLGDLGIFYVIDDGGDSLRYVLSSMLPDGMDEPALFELAHRNLLRDMEFRFCDTSWGGTGILCDGNFEATSLCCPEIWKFIAEQYQEDFIVGVPSRDVIFMVPADSPELIQTQKEIINQILTDGDHTLTNQLFRYCIKDESFSVLE